MVRALQWACQPGKVTTGLGEFRWVQIAAAAVMLGMNPPADLCQRLKSYAETCRKMVKPDLTKPLIQHIRQLCEKGTLSPHSVLAAIGLPQGKAKRTQPKSKAKQLQLTSVTAPPTLSQQCYLDASVLLAQFSTCPMQHLSITTSNLEALQEGCVAHIKLMVPKLPSTGKCTWVESTAVQGHLRLRVLQHIVCV